MSEQSDNRCTDSFPEGLLDSDALLLQCLSILEDSWECRGSVVVFSRPGTAQQAAESAIAGASREPKSTYQPALYERVC